MRPLLAMFFLFTMSESFAGYGTTIEASVLSYNEKELVVIYKDKKILLDNTRLKFASITENCRQDFIVGAKDVLKVSKSRPHHKVVCTNRLAKVEEER